jgi:hypothetical protein
MVIELEDSPDIVSSIRTRVADVIVLNQPSVSRKSAYMATPDGVKYMPEIEAQKVQLSILFGLDGGPIFTFEGWLDNKARRVTVDASHFFGILHKFTAENQNHKDINFHIINSFLVMYDKRPSVLTFPIKETIFDNTEDKYKKRYDELLALKKDQETSVDEAIEFLIKNGFGFAWAKTRVVGSKYGQCFEALVQFAMHGPLGDGDGIDDSLDCWDNDTKLFSKVSYKGYVGVSLSETGMKLFAIMLGFTEFNDAAAYWRLHTHFLKKKEAEATEVKS